jgi:Fe-S cluster assembly iron-binding protein IscA
VVVMLIITEDAALLVRALTDDADRSYGSGLRIIVDPTHHSLSMGVASCPARGDTVVSHGTARVFLSPSAAHRLHRRTLRAELSADRSLFFLDG